MPGFTLSVAGKKPVMGTLTLKPTIPLWRIKHDAELPEGIWRSGLPEVFPLNGETAPFGKAWQLLTFAMNPGMAPGKWRAVFRFDKAFMNRTGFDRPGYPKADHVNKTDLTSPLPRWDKTRVCGGATVTGTVSGGDLIVSILDGSQPAPSLEWMKAHREYWFYAVNSTYEGITNFPQNGGRPVIVPLVGRGVARIPLANVERVEDFADPYRYG